MYYTYVARQPILDSDSVTVGYELLFRDGEANCFPAHIGLDHATYRVVLENFLVLGRNPQFERSRCFINFSYRCLINRLPLTLPKHFVVIEILESCEPTDELFEAIRELYRLGYELALDDFVYSPKWERFLPYIHIIKIDIRTLGLDYACEFVREQKAKRSASQFLAECVETKLEFDQARSAGFTLFQGYYFRKPIIEKHKQFGSVEKLVALRVFAEICRVKKDWSRIEALINSDTDLLTQFSHICHQLAGHPLSQTQFKSVLAHLGEDLTKRAVTLSVIAFLAADKPKELYYLALQRAHFCQLMAQFTPFYYSEEELFNLGLLSILDALFDISIQELSEALPLSQAVKEALLDGRGELGDLLNLKKCLEEADWIGFQRHCDQYGLSTKAITTIINRAQAWSRELDLNA